MYGTEEISESDCKIIALKIRDYIFQPAISNKTTVFLCGADINKKTTIRFKIADVFNSRFWYSDYDFVYPEDIFEELLHSFDTTDLLSLENLLAISVDAVIVIPESPGSYAELGAFANNEVLRNKLICVVDEKYKKDKSFINQGPLKLVKKANKVGIVYVNPDDIGKVKSGSIWVRYERDKEVEKIHSALKKLKKNNPKTEPKITLLQIDRFLLPAIYLLEPVSKSTLNNVVQFAMEGERHSKSVTTMALSILAKKKFIELTVNGYVLTKFLSFQQISNRAKQQDKVVEIDNLRLEILNLRIRKKKLKV